MHVALLVFVGRGCCKNPTKSWLGGLLELRHGAHSREAEAAVYAKPARWVALWDVLRRPKSGIAARIRLRQGSGLPVRW